MDVGIADETAYRVALMLTSVPVTAMLDESSGELDDLAALLLSVTEGKRHTVTIDNLGREADGIAKVEHGYAVSVSGGIPTMMARYGGGMNRIEYRLSRGWYPYTAPRCWWDARWTSW